MSTGEADRAPVDVGGGAWWAARAAGPAAATRRGRPPRSLETIVTAALELIDESGAEAFSMRALAERLGSGTATLYRHFSGRDELFAYVVDQVLGELRADSQAPTRRAREWRRVIAEGSTRLYRVLCRHPNAVALLSARVPVGPNAMAARERGIATLLTAGLPAALAASSYAAIANYVVGFAIQQHGASAAEQPSRSELRELYSSLDVKRFPATIAAGPHLADASSEEEFRFGLELLLDGVERTLKRTRARS